MLSKYGRLHESQLREFDPEQYQRLKASGELRQYLKDVDEAANRSLDRLLQEMLQHSPPPKSLLAKAGHVERLRRSAEEIVLHDLILVPDSETLAARQTGYQGTSSDDSIGMPPLVRPSGIPDQSLDPG